MTSLRPRGREMILIPLTRDGRPAQPRALDALEDRLPAATDCFLFCHGWLYDEAEARQDAERFFAHLDGALRPLGERVAALRVAVHWPSKPFAEPEAGARNPGEALRPEWLSGLGDLALSQPGLLDRLMARLIETEVPLGPEEELELDALLRRIRDGAPRGGAFLSPLHALSFWLMKRRAGQVGERLGREHLAPLFAALGDKAPRLHLIGHSFGAKLLASAVMGGLGPRSLVLLLAAFSAFAFADEVPGTRRPGYYRPVLAGRRIAGPLVALRSVHDRALHSLYPAVTGGGEIDRAAAHPGWLGRARDVVVRSAMGAVGARGVGAPDLDLVDVQRTGLPRCPAINVDGSRVVTRTEWLIGAHRDIYHTEIATLVLMAAGLLEGSPAGARPRPLSPLRLS